MSSVKIYPNWRGITGIRYQYNGQWADPCIIYKRYIYNCVDIENALWDMFCEDTGHKDEERGLIVVSSEFDLWLKDHAKSYLDDCYMGKCYIRKFY